MWYHPLCRLVITHEGFAQTDYALLLIIMHYFAAGCQVVGVLSRRL